MGPRYQTPINPVEDKGCEASIKQQHQSWNGVMCQPKEDGTHQAMATSATIQHKSMTTYRMEL